MKIRHWPVLIVLALLALSSCSSNDDDSTPAASSGQADSGSPDDAAQSGDTAQPSADAESDTGSGSAPPVSADGNASITLGGTTYGFDTQVCDLSGNAAEEVTGVITFDGQPTFVEIFVSTSGTGSVSLNVGLNEDSPIDESLEETMAKGLSQIWQFFFEEDALSEFTDTRVSGAGTFTLVLTTGGNGSSGDTLEGSFTADCS